MDLLRFKNLDEIKAMIIAEHDKDGEVTYDYIQDLIKHFDLSERESQKFIDWAIENDLNLVNGEELPFDTSQNTLNLDDFDSDRELYGNVNPNDHVKLYLKEIGATKLLSREEEQEIARRIEEGNEAEDLILAKYYSTFNVENCPLPIEEKCYRLLEALPEEREYIENITNTYMDGQRSNEVMVQANLRLVVYTARGYIGRGLSFLDLIQEGNIGLMRAIKKFDYRLNYKFSTYATWWIRQAMTRAIADQSRTIRIPVHMVEIINKVKRNQRELSQKLNREPTCEEIAERMGDITPDKVDEALRFSLELLSLDVPVSEDGETTLENFVIEDEEHGPQAYAKNQELLHQIDKALEELDDREASIIKARFGLTDGKVRTLEDIGQDFGITRERVRQIEAKALKKLREPSTKRNFEDFFYQ